VKRICVVAITLCAGLPVLKAQAANEILGSGYTGPLVPNVSAGQVITLFVAPLNVPDAVATEFPLPTSLSGVSVSARVAAGGEIVVDTTGYPTLLPILRVHSVTDGFYIVSNTAVTVQIPGNQVTVEPELGVIVQGFPPYLVLNVNANGVSGPDYTVQVDGPLGHLLNSCDTLFGGVGLTVSNVNQCHPVITHADGTTVSFTNPAKAGETIVVWAVGLYPITVTGVPVSGLIGSTFYNPYGQTEFTYVLDAAPQTGPTNLTAVYLLMPAYVGSVANYVGLFQINVTLPPMPPQTHVSQNAGDANATIGLLTNAPPVPLFVVPD
jgi:hypothetical protein